MDPKIGQSSGARSALGQLLRGVVGVLVALLVVRTWFVEPFVVPSGSMAPTLLGMHAELVCRQCGYRFAYGLNDGAAGRVVCPNCGQVQTEDTDPPGLDGDRVLVDRGAFRWRSPRRWEAIAFRSPAKASEIVVKRVVGLPGETIEIHEGDVYADGRIQRKSLAEQQALAMGVYDAIHLSSGRARWRAETAATHWRWISGRFSWSSTATKQDKPPIDWLSYHHQQLQPGSSTVTEEASVGDSYGYDQTRSRRDLYPVRDLALSFRLRTTGSGQLLIEASDGAVEFVLRLDLERKEAELLHDEQPVASAPCEFPDTASEASLYVSLFDQQVTIAWNDNLLINYPYERPQHPASASSNPFRIAATGMELQIWDLRIERDVYYTPLLTISARSKTRLGSDEYFVLGDNSPESHDSRWLDFGPGVPGHLLIGKPIAVYYPAHVMHAWGRSFQVPEFSNIRYIR